MNREERNVRLYLQPNEQNPATIRNAQFMFLAVEIVERNLTVTSRQELLVVIEGMDAEVQEIAGLQTTAQRQEAADRWEDIMFLVTVASAAAVAFIERTGGKEEVQFHLGDDHPDADRIQELLREQGLIHKEPTDPAT